MAPVVRKRPQEDAINAASAPSVQREVPFNNFAAHNQLSTEIRRPEISL